MSAQFYTLITEVIDLRSFSNLWFWIVLVVMWSRVNHRVLGVPVDMITRARRHEGDARRDMEDLLYINARRAVQGAESTGVWQVALGCFVLTALVLMGFVYGNEFAQAVLLLGVPMLVVRLLSLRLARTVLAEGEGGERLDRRLSQHRTTVQLLGILSILITSFYGMWVNLMLGVLR